MDSDVILTTLAAALELGIAVIVIAALIRRATWSKYAVVVLGAISPLLGFYLYVVLSYIRDPSDKSNVFSFFAVWAMSFLAFAALTLGGLLASFIPRPKHFAARFAVGVAVGPLAYLLVNLTRFSS